MNKKITTSANDILKVPIGNLAKYETKQLYEYFTQATEILEQAKRLKQWLHSAIALKYDVFMEAKRQRLKKDTGIIHIDEPDFKISNDIQKKVEWKQDILGKAVCELVLNGANLSEYVEIHYHIPEAKYNILPQAIKERVEAARIIRLGNPVYKLTKLTTLNDNKFEIVTLSQIMSEWRKSHE